MTEEQKKEPKKGFWANLMDKLDKKMQEKAADSSCCCCGPKAKAEDKKCC